MNAASVVPAPEPSRNSLVIPALLFLLFGVILGWAVNALFSVKPVPVPLVPCRTCADKCPCPRLNGTVRCGCAQ